MKGKENHGSRSGFVDHAARMIVHESGRVLSSSEVSLLPQASQGTCWNGSALPVPLSWSIVVDPQTLWFTCSLPGGKVCASIGSQGQFIEGLWEADVAELFIKGEDGVYQELNLSPSGAWWSMTLSEYRVRREQPKRPVLREIFSSVENDRWRVVAGFEKGSLEVPILSTSRIHVSGMWYRPEPSYLSSYPAQGVAPDYHLEQCFQPISIVKV